MAKETGKTTQKPVTLNLFLAGSVESVVQEFLRERRTRGLSKHTITFYDQELRYFVTWLRGVGVHQVEELTADLIRTYLLFKGETRNKGGVSAAFRAVRVLLFWYESEYDPESWKNPIRKVKVPSGKTEPLPGIDLVTWQKLFDACTGDLAGRDRAVLGVLLDTGCRASELIALNLDDLDNTGALIIRHGKGDKRRTVFIGSETKKLLRRYLKTCGELKPGKPLFTNQTGGRLTYSGLRQIVKRLADRAGVDEPGLHDFRRACAVTLLRNGASLPEVSRLLGHSSYVVTARHLALVDDDLAKAHAANSPVDRLKASR